MLLINCISDVSNLVLCAFISSSLHLICWCMLCQSLWMLNLVCFHVKERLNTWFIAPVSCTNFFYVLWYACLNFMSYYADHIVQVVDLFLYFERWNMIYCICVWILTDRQVKMVNVQTDMQIIISSPFTWLVIFSLWLIQQMFQAVFIIVIIKILTWVQKYSTLYKSASRVPSKVV